MTHNNETCNEAPLSMHLTQIFCHLMGDKEQSGDYITWLLNNTVVL